MLKVQEFLITSMKDGGNTTEEALQHLKEEFGIKYSIWEDQLVTLNYNMISSPKYEELVIECRSLVLEFDSGWEVISRSFDRFFNLGEDKLESDININEMVFHEKLDGSLIGIFKYKGVLLYRTKSMIMPEGFINDTNITWKQRIEECLPSFDTSILGVATYICELTCPENRIVVKYGEVPKLTLLAIRWNYNGMYEATSSVNRLAEDAGLNLPTTYKFTSFKECVTGAAALLNLEEGYVGYNVVGVPCIKVKNPAYVVAHHLRGEGLSTKKVLDLVIDHEDKEYLSVFPEDASIFKPYQLAFRALEATLIEWEIVTIPSMSQYTQREFALHIKNLPEASILFKIRAGDKWGVAFGNLSSEKKRNLIMNNY